MKTNAFGMPTKTSEIERSVPAKVQLLEIRKAILNEKSEELIKKGLEIALNDDHPSQGAMLKAFMDRLLPVSEFEKEGNARTSITISISGIDKPSIDAERIDEA